MTEIQLVEKIQNGDKAAFDELVKTHQDYVLNTCYRFLGSRDDAMDATQDIFINIYYGLNRYQQDAKLSTWIYRIAVNHCLNIRRGKKRRQWLVNASNLPASDEPLENIADRNSSPEQHIQEKEKQDIVNKALNKLNTEQRTTIILHRYQGLSYKEIAEVMQTTVSSVESRIFRAKQQLSKYLKSYIK